MIRHVVIYESPLVTVEQVIDRDQYTVEVTLRPGPVVHLDPDEARELGALLQSHALEPDRCPGTYTEGGCDNYVPCDTHGAP